MEVLLGTLRSKTASRYAYTNDDDFNVTALSRFGVPSDESNQLAEGKKKQEKRDGANSKAPHIEVVVIARLACHTSGWCHTSIKV